MQLHGNNKALVNAIIEKKIAGGDYKEHPDAPEEESAMLYYVMVQLDRLNEEETEESLSAVSELTAEGGTAAAQAACLSSFVALSVYARWQALGNVDLSGLTTNHSNAPRGMFFCNSQGDGAAWHWQGDGRPASKPRAGPTQEGTHFKEAPRTKNYLHVVATVRTETMPEDPAEALTWILTRLTADLQAAKMWPVRLSAVKHQDALSISDILGPFETFEI